MGRSIYSVFANDTSREQQGVTINLGETGSIQVARAGGSNVRFEKRLAELTKDHRRAIQNGLMDEKQAKQILAQVFAETVVIGWSNLTDQAGQPLPFTVDNAKKLLVDLPDLFTLIQQTAQDQTLFRQELLEGDAKN